MILSKDKEDYSDTIEKIEDELQLLKELINNNQIAIKELGKQKIYI